MKVKSDRLAGGMYIITIACGVYAEAFARGDTTFRLGLIADLAMLASYIVVTILFCQLFCSVSQQVSSLAAAFSLVGIAVLACNTIILTIILRLRDSVQFASIGPDLTRLLLRIHGDGYKIGLVFFGLYCLLLGWLIWRGGSMPRLVGFMVAVAGACNLVNSLGWLGAPQLAHRLPQYFTLPTLLGELTLALWLLIFGMRRRHQV